MPTETKQRHKRFTRTHRRRGGTDTKKKETNRRRKWFTKKNLMRFLASMAIAGGIKLAHKKGQEEGLKEGREEGKKEVIQVIQVIQRLHKHNFKKRTTAKKTPGHRKPRNHVSIDLTKNKIISI